MTEPEVSLYIAMYYIKNGMTKNHVQVSIDGAHVKTGNTIHFDIWKFFSDNDFIKLDADADKWQGEYEVDGMDAHIIISSTPGAGDVKIVAPAAVEFRVDPVEGEGCNGENVGPQGAFLPGGVNLGGGHIFHIVREADGHILRIRAGGAQMYGDPLGYIGNDSGHTSSYRFWGGVL